MHDTSVRKVGSLLHPVLQPCETGSGVGSHQDTQNDSDVVQIFAQDLDGQICTSETALSHCKAPSIKNQESSLQHESHEVNSFNRVESAPLSTQAVSSCPSNDFTRAPNISQCAPSHYSGDANHPEQYEDPVVQDDSGLISDHSSSSGRGTSGQVFSDMPTWMWKLFQLSRQLFDDPNQQGPVFPVMTWYTDHIEKQWCTQPKLVHLGPDPDQWDFELQFPWLPDIPFRERVFFDVVVPEPARYPFENHLADVILTTRPVHVSALVVVRIHHDSEDPQNDERFIQLTKTAGMLERTVDFLHLRTHVPGIADLATHGFRFSSDHVAQEHMLIPVHNGMCLTLHAKHLVPNEPYDSDETVLVDITNTLVNGKKRHAFADSDISASMQVHATMPGIQCKNTPYDAQQSDLLSAFASGHADPDFTTVLHEGDVEHDEDLLRDDSQSIQSSGSGVNPPSSDPVRQDVVIFHLQDEPLRAYLDWSDYHSMIAEIARHFSTTTPNVVDAYEVNVPLEGLPPDSVPIIVHLFPDIAVGQNAKLVLFDVDFHGHCTEANFRLGPTSTRSVLVVPNRCDRAAILVSANVDRYCVRESGRCLIWHNSRTWHDYDINVRTMVHGDHIKIALPPTDRCVCPTVQMVQLTQEGLSDAEILDRALEDQVVDGYSPDLLSQEEVRALARQEVSENEDVFQALQLFQGPIVNDVDNRPKVLPSSRNDAQEHRDERNCAPEPVQQSLTDEFIAFINAAQAVPEDQPEFPDQEPDIASQSTFVQDLWEKWTDHATPGPGNVELLAKVETWFTNHRAFHRCMVPRTVVLSREYSQWERQILAVWQDIAMPLVDTSFYLVYPKPEDADAGVFAQVVIVQFPDDALRVHVRSGYALRLSVRRGIRIDFQRLMQLSDNQLREQLSRATHVDVYRRPSWPAFSGDIYAMDDEVYRSRPPAQIDEAHNSTDVPEVPVSHDLPSWITRLREIFRDMSRTEDQWEGPFIDVLVWYLHGQSAESCRAPKVARLDALYFQWRSALVFTCLDQLQRAMPIDVHVVHPSPPRDSGQTHAAHVIVTQQLAQDQRAVIISTNPANPHEERRQFAFVVPSYMSATDVRSAMASSFLARSVRAVWRGPLQFPEGQSIAIENGDGLVIDDFEHEPSHSDRDDLDDSALLQHLPLDPVEHFHEAEEAVSLLQRLSQPVAMLNEPPPASLPVPLLLSQHLDEIPDWFDKMVNPGVFTKLLCSETAIRHVSVELVTGRTFSIAVPAALSSQELSASITNACELLDPMSDFVEISFRRSTWVLPSSSWCIASVRRPNAHMVIVLCLFCAGPLTQHAVRTLPEFVSESSLRQALNARYGTRVMVNGIPVSGQLTLSSGDVIEVFAHLTCPLVSNFDGNRVTISLEASLPSAKPDFLPDGNAWCFSERLSWYDDLSESIGTKFLPPPEGLDLHAVTFEALHQQDSATTHHPETVELYVDGSAFHDRAGWAVVAVSVGPNGRVFQGCLAGTVTLNPRDPTWIGAKSQNNIDAELTAMAVAQNVAIQVSHAWPVVIRPDLHFSHQLAVRTAVSKHSYVLPQLVHVLGQLVSDQVSIQEVRGHDGNQWNELADRLAKHAVLHASSFGIFDWDALRSLAMTEDNFKWAWRGFSP
eukprot:s1362_g24.t1